MKNNSTKHSRQLLQIESSSLRMVYKNEDVINNDIVNSKGSKAKTGTPNKLYVKEPLPMFNDYKFKAKDHDPL